MEKEVIHSGIVDYEKVLELAVENDDIELLHEILEHDPYIAQCEFYNLPFSTYVCLSPRPKILQYLIDNKLFYIEDNILSLVMEIFVSTADLMDDEKDNYIKVVQILFDNEIYFDSLGQYDWGFLYLEGDIKILNIDLEEHIRYLINTYNIDLNKPVMDEFGTTPLLEACFYSGPDLVLAMINNGAYLDENAEGELNPLVMAIVNHKLDNIKLLIDKGFDISKSNNHDLLSLAVTKKDLNMITFLLDNGVLLSESEAFSVCCESGNSEIMEFFLNMGINPNEVLNNGRLPLELAIKHNNIEVIKTLIQHGSNIYNCNLYGLSPFTQALKFNNTHFFSILKNMLNFKETHKHNIYSIDMLKIKSI